MNRTRVVVVVSMLAAAAVMPLPAGARSSTRMSTAAVFRSAGCSDRVNLFNPATWACTTVTVNPFQMRSGASTAVTYSFRAKRDLRYVDVCFSKMLDLFNCAYTHRYSTLRRGAIVTSVVPLTAPSLSGSADLRLDDSAHFYRKWSTIKPGAVYWSAGSYACVIAPSQPAFQCRPPSS